MYVGDPSRTATRGGDHQSSARPVEEKDRYTMIIRANGVAVQLLEQTKGAGRLIFVNPVSRSSSLFRLTKFHFSPSIERRNHGH